MEYRLVVLGHQNRREEARAVERTIREVCDQRKPFDSEAANVESRLRRRADAIHSPRVANDRLKRAIAFLDPEGDGRNPRSLVEYVLTLNNLGANEMLLGDFPSAFSKFALAFRIAERSQGRILKRSEILLSNLVVCHFLTTEQVPAQVHQLQEAVRVLSITEADTALVQSNLAALQIYGGDLQGGYRNLRETAESIAPFDDRGAYHLYFVHSNLAVAAFLAISDEEAGASLVRAEEAVGALDPDIRPYARTRLELLKGMLDGGVDRSLVALQTIINPEDKRIGESWRLHGRPLSFIDLQFWTEG
jgi:hypothetical protein